LGDDALKKGDIDTAKFYYEQAGLPITNEVNKLKSKYELGRLTCYDLLRIDPKLQSRVFHQLQNDIKNKLF
jgi:hypothetical protein